MRGKVGLNMKPLDGVRKPRFLQAVTDTVGLEIYQVVYGLLVILIGTLVGFVASKLFPFIPFIWMWPGIPLVLAYPALQLAQSLGEMDTKKHPDRAIRDYIKRLARRLDSPRIINGVRSRKATRIQMDASVAVRASTSDTLKEVS